MVYVHQTAIHLNLKFDKAWVFHNISYDIECGKRLLTFYFNTLLTRYNFSDL